MKNLLNKIDKLQAVIETGKLLNSSRNSDEILDFFLRKSIELIDGGDTGIIFIYNENSKMLEVKFYAGFNDHIRQVRLSPGESMTGIAFSTQKTIFYDSDAEIKKAMKTMRPENSDLLKKSLNCNADTIRVYGSICCPLLYKGDCLGVVVIDNLNNYSALTSDDVSVLEAISVQAIIAIINARNFEKELENIKTMEKYSKLLEEERNKYRYSSNLHSKFSEMVLNGSNVEDILSEIGSLLNRDVFILDLFYNIDYCYFKYHSDMETVTRLTSGFINHLSDTISQFYCNDANLFLYFNPIVVNLDILGWLCIVSDSSDYTELDKISIEKGITILALQLLKKNEISDMEQFLRGDFLDNLIQNQNKEYLMRLSKNYKFRFDRNHQIIIIELKADKSHPSPQKSEFDFKRYVRHYYDIMSKEANKVFPNAVALIKGNSVIIILEGENKKKKITSFLEQALNTNIKYYMHMNSKITLKAGVSDIIRSVDNFKGALANTQQTIRILDSLGGEKFYLFYDDLEIKKLLLNNTKENLENFLFKVLGPLINYQNNSKELLNTLKIYIQNNRNWTYTKSCLHIHGNTLTYRLKRCTDLLNTDLNDYNELLKIQIAFAIYDILPLYNIMEN